MADESLTAEYDKLMSAQRELTIEQCARIVEREMEDCASFAGRFACRSAAGKIREFGQKGN